MSNCFFCEIHQAQFVGSIFMEPVNMSGRGRNINISTFYLKHSSSVPIWLSLRKIPVMDMKVPRRVYLKSSHSEEGEAVSILGRQ